MTGATTSPARTDDLVAVVEADPAGHRLHYLRHLHRAAGDGRCLVLLSAAAAGSAEYRMHAGPMASSTVVLGDVRSRADLLSAAIARAVDSGARRLVVPDGDFYLLPLLKTMIRHPRLALEIRVLVMRTTTVGGPERLRPATVVKPVLIQLLRLFPQLRILFLTDALGVVTRRRGYRGLQAVRDPALHPAGTGDDRPAWFPPPDPAILLVGVFGVVGARKNLPLLVEAVARTPEAVLVVGGRLELAVRAFVDTDATAQALLAHGRMVVADRLLDAHEFAGALAAVDVAAVLHANDAPSGILAEACVRHTPVLVPTGGWLAQVVDATGVGTASALEVADVARALGRLADHRADHVAATRRQAGLVGTADFTDRLLGG